MTNTTAAKDLAHAAGRDVFHQDAACDAAEEDSWDQKQPGVPGNVAGFVVGEEREQSGGWNQGDQAGALRAMLVEKNRRQHQETAEKDF
jgi:hypothetical protein